MLSNVSTKNIVIYSISLLLSIPCLLSTFVDDTYIHARIVQNFIDYGAFIFNIGDTTKIDSSTLYVALLVPLATIIDPLWSIRIFQSVIVFIFSVLMLRFIWSQEHRVAISIVAILTMSSVLASGAYIGMESSLACLLLFLTYVMLREEKMHWAIFFAAVAACVRFEMIMLFVLVSFYIWREGKYTLKLLPYSLPLFFLYCYEIYAFGTIIPHAALAKSIGYNIPYIDSWQNALQFKQSLLHSLAMLPGYVFLVYRAFLAWKNKLSFTMYDIFIFFSLGLLTMWGMGKSIIFEWYRCQLSMALFCVFVQYMHSIKNTWKKVCVPYMLFALISALNFGSLWGLINIYAPPSPSLRVDYYLNIGATLSKVLPSGSLVTSEVGGLGYSFTGKILDAFGLSDQGAVNYHPLEVPRERPNYHNGAIPPRYVADRNPDFVVSMPTFIHAFEKSEIAKKYHVYFCPFPKGVVIWGSENVRIYSKEIIPDSFLQEIACQKN